MRFAEIKRPFDTLSTISALSIIVLLSLLWFIAQSNPASQNLVLTVMVGLGAGGLILFRQLRSNARRLIMSEARAQYAATHDDLTQLPTKTLFLDRIAALPGKANFGVFCIGVDQFEDVYELFGQAAGERTLREFSTRLVASCPEYDSVARISDGVFAVFWAGLTPAKALGVADQLLLLLSAPYLFSDEKTFLSPSIGVAFWCASEEGPEEGIRRARLALSNARKQGGACVRVFDQSMDVEFKARKALEGDLRKTLTDGGLTMVYQPQYNARNLMTGVEALIRWDDARGVAVSLVVFVPLAERCGMSGAIDRFSLKQAFLDSLRWPTLKVAVNVSATTIQGGGLIVLLQEILASTGANPRNIELEITESVLMSDDPATYDVLKSVRRMGFSLAIDDFGTGYSSLSYLKRFPIDKIKIDRSFITHLGMQPESDAIVRAIVEMAQALDLRVIAEGVETRFQIDRLAVAGCFNFQGFYFSKPIVADAITELHARRAIAA